MFPYEIHVVSYVVDFRCTSSGVPGFQIPTHGSCDMPEKGFQCCPNVTHSWGQYSPAFSVPSQIIWETPQSCKITLAQILSRHGARYPTSKMSDIYNATVRHIQQHARNLTGEFAFLSNYSYNLDTDQLTDFGRREMMTSGIALYERYRNLAVDREPFVRASGTDRVVESADRFLMGYYEAKEAAQSSSLASSKRHTSTIRKPENYHLTHPILILPESPFSNNT